MQDALARLYFLDREPAVPTTTLATCTGRAGTIIPTGALAKATTGDLYACVTGGTIPAGGSIDLSFACATTGPVVLPANALTTIYLAVPGWDTINNASAGVVGRNAETRAEFEQLIPFCV